jgi:hypothetical protein
LLYADGHIYAIDELGKSAVVAPGKSFKVIATSELGEKLHFGWSQMGKLALGAAVTLLVYFVVFGYQAPLLDVLGGAAHARRPWIAPLLVAAVAPVVAWSYGMVASSLLKLIRLE